MRIVAAVRAKRDRPPTGRSARLAAAMLITPGCIASFAYTLTNPEGEVLDQSAPDRPLAYLHGAGNIVPGLERQLEGLAAGDSRNVVVPPAEGYGEATGRRARVPRTQFPDHIQPQVGMGLAAEGPDGHPIPMFIIGVDDNEVIFSLDHPLAGVELRFAVSIVEVRTATDEELAHGHPHGPGGHHHG